MSLKSRVWRSFKSQINCLFVTGYKLPEALQVIAIGDLDEKLNVWRSELDKAAKEHVNSKQHSEPNECDDAEVSIETDKSNMGCVGDVEVNQVSKHADATNELDKEGGGRNGNRHSQASRYGLRNTKTDFRRLAGKRERRSRHCHGNQKPSQSDDVKQNDKLEPSEMAQIEMEATFVENEERNSSEEGTLKSEISESKSLDANLHSGEVEQHEINPAWRDSETTALTGDGRDVEDIDMVEASKSDSNNSMDRCYLCRKTFKHHKRLNAHVKLHEKSSFPCSSCDFIGYRPSQVKAHRWKEHKTIVKASSQMVTKKQTGKQFPCSSCDKVFSSTRALKAHAAFHTSGPKKCPDCPKEFNSEAGYENHLKIHTGLGLHQCPLCGYEATGSSTIKVHIKRMHERSKSHLCDFCGRGFYTSLELQRHREGSHMRDQFKDRYHCKQCNFKTHSSTCLKAHIRNVHSTRPVFECHICGVRVKYKNSLDLHIQRHFGIRAFNCPQCSFQGICQKDVQAHIKRLHMGTTYRCELCPKTFNDKGHLVRHQAVHSKEKNYVCDHCDFRCNVQGNLSSHLWAKHQIKAIRRPLLSHVMSPEKLQELANSNGATVTVQSDLTTPKHHNVKEEEVEASSKTEQCNSKKKDTEQNDSQQNTHLEQEDCEENNSEQIKSERSADDFMMNCHDNGEQNSAQSATVDQLLTDNGQQADSENIGNPETQQKTSLNNILGDIKNPIEKVFEDPVNHEAKTRESHDKIVDHVGNRKPTVVLINDVTDHTSRLMDHMTTAVLDATETPTDQLSKNLNDAMFSGDQGISTHLGHIMTDTTSRPSHHVINSSPNEMINNVSKSPSDQTETSNHMTPRSDHVIQVSHDMLQAAVHVVKDQVIISNLTDDTIEYSDHMVQPLEHAESSSESSSNHRVKACDTLKESSDHNTHSVQPSNCYLPSTIEVIQHSNKSTHVIQPPAVVAKSEHPAQPAHTKQPSAHMGQMFQSSNHMIEPSEHRVDHMIPLMTNAHVASHVTVAANTSGEEYEVQAMEVLIAADEDTLPELADGDRIVLLDLES